MNEYPSIKQQSLLIGSYFQYIFTSYLSNQSSIFINHKDEKFFCKIPWPGKRVYSF